MTTREKNWLTDSLPNGFKLLPIPRTVLLFRHVLCLRGSPTSQREKCDISGSTVEKELVLVAPQSDVNTREVERSGD